MCGRFNLKANLSQLRGAFHVELPDYQPRFNIAPTQPIWVVRSHPQAEGRQAVQMRWGLVPSWAKDLSIGNRMINARSETVAEKPAYRQAFRRRRCLVLATGFYEWLPAGGHKQPYFIHLPDESPLAMAGLWETWGQGDDRLESCTILTMAAGPAVSDIHERMPVIIAPEDYDRWIDPEQTEPAQLEPLLRSSISDDLTAQPVSQHVNNPRHDDPRCLEPDNSRLF